MMHHMYNICAERDTRVWDVGEGEASGGGQDHAPLYCRGEGGEQRQEAVQGQGVGGVEKLQAAAELRAHQGCRSNLTWGTSSFTGVAQKIGGNNTEIALQNLY